MLTIKDYNKLQEDAKLNKYFFVIISEYNKAFQERLNCNNNLINSYKKIIEHLHSVRMENNLLAEHKNHIKNNLSEMHDHIKLLQKENAKIKKIL